VCFASDLLGRLNCVIRRHGHAVAFRHELNCRSVTLSWLVSFDIGMLKTVSPALKIIHRPLPTGTPAWLARNVGFPYLVTARRSIRRTACCALCGESAIARGVGPRIVKQDRVGLTIATVTPTRRSATTPASLSLPLSLSLRRLPLPPTPARGGRHVPAASRSRH
jgi:hypothetical protein